MGLYFQTWNSTCFPALFSQLYIYLLIRLFFCLFLLLKIDTFRTSPAQEQAMPAKRTGRLLLMACLRKSSTPSVKFPKTQPTATPSSLHHLPPLLCSNPQLWQICPSQVQALLARKTGR